MARSQNKQRKEKKIHKGGFWVLSPLGLCLFSAQQKKEKEIKKKKVRLVFMLESGAHLRRGVHIEILGSRDKFK